MFQKLKEVWTSWCKEGMYFPYAHNPTTKKPSITLLFPYVTFVMAVLSLIAMHFKDSLFSATATAITFWVISVIFYRLGKLDKVKFDVDDRSIELEGSDTNKKGEPE
jgi:hypothetical protein